MKTFFYLCLLMGVISCGKNSTSSSSRQNQETQKPEVTHGSFAEEYLKYLNNYRDSLGLRKLKYAKPIEEVATEHSTYMAARRGRFGHWGWRNRCKKLMDELDGVFCSEIVAMGQTTPKDVLNAWIRSSAHRKELENPDVTHTGLGIRKNTKGVIYWTQILIKKP